MNTEIPQLLDAFKEFDTYDPMVLFLSPYFSLNRFRDLVRLHCCQEEDQRPLLPPFIDFWEG